MAEDFTKLIETLKRHEGFVPHAYKCPAGYWTIGYGRMIDERRGGGISKEEAEYLLKNDVDKIRKELKTKAPWILNLDDERRDAIFNMAFQLGVPTLMKFKKMLTALQVRRYEEAYREALDSKWARQTPERAKEVALQIKG